MVSRETGSWTIDQFLSWHKKNILIEHFGQTVGMSIDALSVVLLSLISASGGFTVVLSPKETDAFLFYSSCYGLFPGLSFFLPGQGKSGAGVSGFITENQRYREEGCFMLSRNYKKGLLFSTQDAVDSILMPTVSDHNKPMSFSINNKVKMSFVIHHLNLWGYVKTDRVVNPLYYSVRGGILDIFPVNSRNPVRVEFFGDTVESIRLFNPYSQRTIKKINRVMVLPRALEKQDQKQSVSSFVQEKKNIKQWKIKPTSSNLYRLNLNKKQHEFSWGSFLPLSNKHILSFSEKNINKTCFVFSEKNGHINLPDPFQKTSNIKRVNATIGSGFFLKENVAVLGTNNVPELPISQRSRWMIEGSGGGAHSKILDISDLEWEEPLVHEDFGIGTYRGLEATKVGECIKLKYADGGAVYVPVASFHKIHRLVGVPGGSVKISSLKTKQWGRKKKAVKQYAESIAGGLLKTYLERQASRGFSYNHSGDLYKAVCESFPYNETKDQLVALKEVILDMKRSIPMDRLICGDVGFGKTEIAIRATIIAIESGKMVFILAPTTVLANQHFISFCGRFSPLGARVELLSRFKTKKEQKKIIESASSGKVDVLVGTHRLLSDDVSADGLGLIVIDEEHRFGVKQKEKIKSLKASVDILTLTATPIPRTLKQSLTGMKNISVINTPPKSRKPIKTYVLYFDWEKIFKVIEAEINRGGQVFFVHNNIQSLPFINEKIETKFKNCVVRSAHGKMNSRVLEKTMLGFFNSEIDILCCTTIVGSGLDVPRANTMIVNNAHCFGLSQLYQIRGRVGRSVHQGYCYLFVPKGRVVEGVAFQRLKTLEQNTSLGSGYKVALKDMNIRGAGDLFGTKQSGVVSSVGFHMYNKILKEALDKERGIKNEKNIPKISTAFSSGISEDYMPLIEDRLYFYQTLALADSLNIVDDIKEEMLDRFGKAPVGVLFLLEISKLRVLLTNSSVQQVYIHKKGLDFSVTSLSPFTVVEDYYTHLSSSFGIRNNDILLKNKKDRCLSVSLTGMKNQPSSVGKIISSFEMMFLNN